MRLGPEYHQWVDEDKDGRRFLRLPLELEQEWFDKSTVVWKDNGDGTYTLTPYSVVADR